MTLSQIMTLALRQLDEDAQDISEYDGAFKAYANIGYEIAVREYVKPREHLQLRTDEQGEAGIEDGQVVRVIDAKDARSGRPVAFALTQDGRKIATGEKNARLDVLCQVRYPQMTEETGNPGCRNTSIMRWRITSATGICPRAAWPSRAGRSSSCRASMRRCG